MAPERGGERAVNDLQRQMLAALEAQHQAIDALMAELIAVTADTDTPFFPSRSGWIWAAVKQGSAAIKRAKSTAGAQPIRTSAERSEEEAVARVRERFPLAVAAHHDRGWFVHAINAVGDLYGFLGCAPSGAEAWIQAAQLLDLFADEKPTPGETT